MKHFLAFLAVGYIVMATVPCIVADVRGPYPAPREARTMVRSHVGPHNPSPIQTSALWRIREAIERGE